MDNSLETIQAVLADNEADMNEKYSLAVSSAYLLYALKKPE